VKRELRCLLIRRVGFFNDDNSYQKHFSRCGFVEGLATKVIQKVYKVAFLFL